ncbi:MAG TPA: ABC transporter permease [Candidatus Methylomirabilis sp.]|nr:ABC transporter permease [Candidatus Methylomirabilis sp.]
MTSRMPRAASRDGRRASGVSPWHDALRRLQRNRLAMLGLGVLSCLVLSSLAAPWISPYPYDRTDLRYGAKPPSGAHLLGTDELGRDLLTRILYGARISFAVGILATVVSLTIGVSYGSVAGSVGGRLDHLMMRLVDILYGLPFMFFVIILMVIFGRSILNLFIALGAVQWLTMARIVRGQVMSLKVQEFVLSAQALGASASRIVTRHLLLNALGPIVVYATLTVPAVMLEEAFLSFLGLGVQPPMASWGSLASEGAAAMETYPWLIVFPGLALTLTLLSLNFLGDGLRDALDPQVTARR